MCLIIVVTAIAFAGAVMNANGGAADVVIIVILLLALLGEAGILNRMVHPV